MKVPFLSFVVLAALLSGCQGATKVEVPNENTGEIAPAPMTETFTSSAFDLSFTLPEGLMVTEFPEFLVVDTADRTGFEGELMNVMKISFTDEDLKEALMSAEEGHNTSVAAAGMRLTTEQSEFRSDTVKEGDWTYTRAFVYSAFGDRTLVEYFLEQNGRTIVVTLDGGPEKWQDSLSIILGSLTF